MPFTKNFKLKLANQPFTVPLLADERLDRWHRIKEFVRIIKSTKKVTIMSGWEKTRLTEGLDFDDIIFEEPDNVEEV